MLSFSLLIFQFSISAINDTTINDRDSIDIGNLWPQPKKPRHVSLSLSLSLQWRFLTWLGFLIVLHDFCVCFLLRLWVMNGCYLHQISSLPPLGGESDWIPLRCCYPYIYIFTPALWDCLSSMPMRVGYFALIWVYVYLINYLVIFFFFVPYIFVLALKKGARSDTLTLLLPLASIVCGQFSFQSFLGFGTICGVCLWRVGYFALIWVFVCLLSYLEIFFFFVDDLAWGERLEVVARWPWWG